MVYAEFGFDEVILRDLGEWRMQGHARKLLSQRLNRVMPGERRQSFSSLRREGKLVA
jgi:hypothetical protein